jgi:hypothetical protein
MVIAFLARAMVAAYAFSYFFSANTIICLLMRKHVDRIEVEEIYEHKTGEEETATLPEEVPAAPDEKTDEEKEESAEGE